MAVCVFAQPGCFACQKQRCCSVHFSKHNKMVNDQLTKIWTAPSYQPNCLEDIVLVGCSNKALEVYDMNLGQSIRTVTDVHTRPVHCLAQNKVATAV